MKNKIQDIKGTKKKHFSYISAKNFRSSSRALNFIGIALLAFLIIFFVNSISIYYKGKKLQQDVSTSAFQGYNLLMDAGKSTTKIQFEKAQENFKQALENFGNAQESLWFYNSDQSIYANNTHTSLAVNNLLDGGTNFARAGSYFLEAIDQFNKIPIYFVNKNAFPDKPTPSITEALNEGLEKTDLAIKEITEASDKINQIDESVVPEHLRNKTNFAKEKIAEISEILISTQKHFPAILELLGDKHPHRYLILLQNNNELRPTGGFIGSFAILDINDGYIEKLETYDSYELDGTYGEHIEPPDEFRIFTDNWRLRDSNYSSDFPLSAKKAMWFLQKEGGPTVDTVIAINQGLLKDMLTITGPIQVGEFGELNAENYTLLLSFIIESKFWGEEDPKHILKTFIPAFKKAILKEEHLGKVSSKLFRAIQQKHILMYSPDEDIQALFDAIGTSGRQHVLEEGEDYLSVINISTGGTKSDKFIEEKIHHHSEITDKGEIINTVKITKTHLWTDDIYRKWVKILNNYGIYQVPDYLVDILGRGRNRNSIRVYVPPNSQLIDSNKTDIITKYDTELDKTYFFSSLELLAGETAELEIKYSLPFTLDLEDTLPTYKLIAEKQPGHPGAIFTKTLMTSSNVTTVLTYPEEAETSLNTSTYATDLVYDRYFSALLQKD